MVKISPSILSADFTKLGQEIDTIKTADYLHFDVMDGVFVKNISIGLPVLQSVRKYTDMFLDVHLMITEPVKYIEDFAAAGADLIVVHAEADKPENIRKAIDLIKKCGKKAGIALKPATGAVILKDYIADLDLVLVMTVEPGFGGQKFMNDMMDKVSQVRKMITDGGYDCEVEVDGGINRETARISIDAGANVLVAGSSVINAKDRAGEIEALRCGM